MAELIEWCFEHVSYWTVAFFMALENSLVPFPSEAIVPPAGYKAAAGEMSFLLVVVFATLGVRRILAGNRQTAGEHQRQKASSRRG